MNNNINVSIVVPIYNVENYIETTLSCILKQSLKSIEIILIDDCSTDRSYEIARKFTKDDNRVKLIKLEENSGSSKARNLGISLSKGEYISFLDSDDIFDLDMILNMYTCAKKYNADIVTCGFSEVSEEGEVYFEYTRNEGFINKDKDIIRLPVIPWNKIYKRELFEDIIFPEGLLHQDYGTIPIVLAKSKNIYNINKNYVKHIVHRSSVTYKSLTQKNKNRFDVLINAKRLLENDYMLKFYGDRINIYPLIISGIVSKTQVYILNKDVDGLREYFSKVDELIPKFKFEVKGYSLNQKLFILIYKLKAYNLYIFLMRLRKNHYTK